MRQVNQHEINQISGGSKRSERLKGQSPWAQIGKIAAGAAAGGITGAGIGGCVGGPVGLGAGALWGSLAGGYATVKFKLYKA